MPLGGAALPQGKDDGHPLGEVLQGEAGAKDQRGRPGHARVSHGGGDDHAQGHALGNIMQRHGQHQQLGPGHMAGPALGGGFVHMLMGDELIQQQHAEAA